MIKVVHLSKKAFKQLEKMPVHIIDKLDTWIEAVELDGLERVGRIPGYHDEPLKGNRQGERSIRLSKAYRAIYQIQKEGVDEFINIQEVSKHDY